MLRKSEFECSNHYHELFSHPSPNAFAVMQEVNTTGAGLHMRRVFKLSQEIRICPYGPGGVDSVVGRRLSVNPFVEISNIDERGNSGSALTLMFAISVVCHQT